MDLAFVTKTLSLQGSRLVVLCFVYCMSCSCTWSKPRLYLVYLYCLNLLSRTLSATFISCSSSLMPRDELYSSTFPLPLYMGTHSLICQLSEIVSSFTILLQILVSIYISIWFGFGFYCFLYLITPPPGLPLSTFAFCYTTDCSCNFSHCFFNLLLLFLNSHTVLNIYIPFL